MADDLEEQYLLRVQDRELAARLARVLQEDAAAQPADADISLEFDGGPALHVSAPMMRLHLLLSIQ